MGDEIGRTTDWYYCLRHRRVEPEAPGRGTCPAKYLLGPYPDPDSAAHALESISEREKELTAEDREWAGEDDPRG